MLQLETEITVEHEGTTFVFKYCDIFDLIEAEALAKDDTGAYYKWFLNQLVSVTGIKNGLEDVTLDDLNNRRLKLPFPFLAIVIAKFKNKILTGKDVAIVSKDEAEKNE